MGRKKQSKENPDAIELTMDELVQISGIREADKSPMTTQIDAIYEERGFMENLSLNCPRDQIEKDFRREHDIEGDTELTEDQEATIQTLQLDCEQTEQDKLHTAIRKSVIFVADSLFDNVKLNVDVNEDQYMKDIDSKVVTITPSKDWEDSARELWMLADCSGLGSAGGFKEFKDQEGKSGKALVKDLLGWAKTHSQCYGKGKTPPALFDEVLDLKLR